MLRQLWRMMGNWNFLNLQLFSSISVSSTTKNPSNLRTHSVLSWMYITNGSHRKIEDLRFMKWKILKVCADPQYPISSSGRVSDVVDRESLNVAGETREKLKILQVSVLRGFCSPSHISRQLTHWHNSQFSPSKAPVGDEENEFYGVDRTLLMNKIILCHFSLFHVPTSMFSTHSQLGRHVMSTSTNWAASLPLFLRSDSIWMRNLSANIFLFNSTSSSSFQLTFACRSDQHST